MVYRAGLFAMGRKLRRCAVERYGHGIQPAAGPRFAEREKSNEVASRCGNRLVAVRIYGA